MAITDAATVPVIAPRIAPTMIDRVGEPARHRAEQLTDAFEQVLGEAASLEDRAHEGEERDRQQQVVRHDAERPVGQRLKELRSEVADLDRRDAEGEAEGGSEKATGKPISRKAIRPANIVGAMYPYSSMRRVRFRLLKGPFVFGGLVDVATQSGDALDRARRRPGEAAARGRTAAGTSPARAAGRRRSSTSRCCGSSRGRTARRTRPSSPSPETGRRRCRRRRSRACGVCEAEP